MYDSLTSKNKLRKRTHKITFDQWLFLAGVFAKQFYLFPSGTLQIGDILMLCSFLCYFVFKKGGRISVLKDEGYLLGYLFFIFVINSVYYLLYDNIGFMKSTLYYLFNILALIIFVVYINRVDSLEFLEGLRKVLQGGLLIQTLIFLLGLGKWYGGGRYEGTFNDPNQYGVFILLSALFIYMTGYILNKKSWFWIALSFLLVLQSASTGMLIGYIAFFVAYIFSINKKKAMFWIAILCVVLFLIIGTANGLIKMPTYITDLPIYERLFDKTDNLVNDSLMVSVSEDRGWDRIWSYPAYILFGSGEGGNDRFGSTYEIHSSILGPLFYYGIVPFSLFITWCCRKVKGLDSRLWCVYVALLAECFFIISTRQPMFWMLIALAGTVAAKSEVFRNASVQPTAQNLMGGYRRISN